MPNANETLDRAFLLALNPVMLTNQEIKDIRLLLEKVKKERAKNA